jgi:hypothetical protein
VEFSSKFLWGERLVSEGGSLAVLGMYCTGMLT